MRSLKAAIVGTGRMGQLYQRELDEIEGVELVAFVSSHTDDASSPVAHFPTIAQLVQELRPDVCCVCTPSFLHAAQSKELLLAGIPVICEKPVALHAKEAKELYALSHARHVPFFAAHVVRFSRAAQFTKSILQQGCYGRVLDADFTRLSQKPFWSKQGWALEREKSGHLDFDLHLHDLDLIFHLFGSPLQALRQECGSKTKPYAEHCRYRYAYPSFTVYAQAAWMDASIPFIQEWKISLERAFIWAKGDAATLYTENGDPIVMVSASHSLHSTGLHVPSTDMYSLQLRHFISCLLGQQASSVICPEQVIEALQMLERFSSEESSI